MTLTGIRRERGRRRSDALRRGDVDPGAGPLVRTGGGPAAQLRDVGVRYGTCWAVRAVDLSIVSGEVLALVGPNGAGKSSLLSVLAGDRAPTTGEVRLGGDPLEAHTPASLARERAVLPQASTVAFPFTVAEVVRMGRAPWAGTPAADDDDRAVAAAMHQADVTALADRVVPSLSGGEQARVALARVLAQHTALLLLDEPTAALDLKHQEATMRIARARAAAGAAVVVVLHDLGLAAAHADRVALVASGRLRAVGTPSEVFDAALLTEVYDQPIEVLAHPRGGPPIVVPRR